MSSFLKVTVLLFLMPLTGYSQTDKSIAVTYQNQIRYCITETQALLVVEVFDQSEVHKGIILDLEAKVKSLESISESQDVIINETDTIIGIEVERTNQSKQEVRRLKTKAVGVWFKGALDKILYAAGGVAVGVGVGVAVSK